MVGSLGDTCWSGFCTGNCVATCTGGGMTARKAVWDKLMFVDMFVNSIHYHWYCIDIRGVCGRLDWHAVQGRICHGQ